MAIIKLFSEETTNLIADVVIKKYKAEIELGVGNYSCEVEHNGYVLPKGTAYISVHFDGHSPSCEGSATTFLTIEEAKEHIDYLYERHSGFYNIQLIDKLNLLGTIKKEVVGLSQTSSLPSLEVEQ